VREGLALVHCDPHVAGRPWPFAPRVILKAMLAQAAPVELFAGAEVEYFLVNRDAEGRLAPADERECACAAVLRRARPDPDVRPPDRGVLGDERAGWGNYANDHEDGNGQFEQNFAYADALTTADRVITARY